MTFGGPVSRDGAREEARRELSRPLYAGSRPNWWHRAVGWINDRLSDLFHRLFPHDGGPGGTGGLGVLALVVVFVVAVVALRWWLGPVRRTARTRQQDHDLSSPLTAARLRSEADEHAARGDYAAAVRSRLRAIVRMLEETGVLDPRPGRTAGELVEEISRFAPPAGDAGGRTGPPDGPRTPPGPPAPATPAAPQTHPSPEVPGVPRADATHREPAPLAVMAQPAAAMTAAVEVFSEVWYGGRPATAAGYQIMVDADGALSRLRHGRTRVDAAPSLTVPG